VPIAYAFFYKEIKEKNRSKVISTAKIKEIIRRKLVAGHLPKWIIYSILEEMEECRLIKRVNHLKYRILQHPCEKKLRRFFW